MKAFQKNSTADQRFTQHFTQKWKDSVFTLGHKRSERDYPVKITWNFCSESQRNQVLTYLNNLMQGTDAKSSSIISYDEEKMEIGGTLMLLTPRITISNPYLIEKLYQEANRSFIQQERSQSSLAIS